MGGVLLHAESLPDEVRALIASKAEGNPFFVEEILKTLVETGALLRSDSGYALTRRLDVLLIPETIQDLLMARIDRLAEMPKRTLQFASVIGREFSRRLLDQLPDLRAHAEAALEQLKALEFIYETISFPERVYRFKHALTSEVAYSSLLVHRRKDLHRLIGSAIETLYADRLAHRRGPNCSRHRSATRWRFGMMSNGRV